MKKSKRLISLILAVVMVLSFMAMSASAATVEIQAVSRRAACPRCGGNGWQTGTVDGTWREGTEYITCSNMSVPHVHWFKTVVTRATCRTCGYVDYTETIVERCPHA